MTPVVLAAAGEPWEADVVTALDGGRSGLTVTRRCVDLADLLATAAAGTVRVALVSARLRRLDRDAVGRLAANGVAVVVVAADEEGERLGRQLGAARVLPADLPAADLVAGLLDAAEGTTPAQPSADAVPAEPPTTGTLIAVWGPTGAPGRTTVAVGLAAEAAVAGREALLVDADVYGGVVAQVLGIVDDAPGIAAACRLANTGRLDVPALAGLARAVGPALRVLPGIARAERWPELRPDAVEEVLRLARILAPVTVVDCGFALEQDEELAYDTAAPRRNGATVRCLELADTVLAVGSADPVGLQRLIRGLGELRDRVPGGPPRVVVNRLRDTAVPGDPRKEITAALQRYAGVDDVRFVPEDRPALDAAVAAGRTLPEAAPGSAARLALRDLTAELLGVEPPRRRRLRRRP